MTTYSDPSCEITGEEDIIRLSDARERMEKIEPWRIGNLNTGEDIGGDFAREDDAHAWLDASVHVSLQPHLSVYQDEDDIAELEALQELLAELGWADDSAFLVRSDHMKDFALEEAESLTEGADYLFSYVDWEEVADYMVMDMRSLDFRGTTYYTRG